MCIFWVASTVVYVRAWTVYAVNVGMTKKSPCGVLFLGYVIYISVCFNILMLVHN